MIIESGNGRNNANVTNKFRLLVESVQKAVDRDLNMDGKNWSLPFENIDPTGADDNFVYLKNTSAGMVYEITDIRVSSTVAGQAKLIVVTGTASGGTDITPVAKNVGIGTSPDVTIQSGVDITGLTDGGTIYDIQMDAADKEAHLRTTAHVMIRPNQAVAMVWEEATGILTGVVSLVERDL